MVEEFGGFQEIPTGLLYDNLAFFEWKRVCLLSGLSRAHPRLLHRRDSAPLSGGKNRPVCLQQRLHAERAALGDLLWGRSLVQSAATLRAGLWRAHAASPARPAHARQVGVPRKVPRRVRMPRRVSAGGGPDLLLQSRRQVVFSGAGVPSRHQQLPKWGPRRRRTGPLPKLLTFSTHFHSIWGCFSR